ncbi:MAG: hypothetical protein AWM53_01892 [Candidatus Dichloromethanomonas elyunquensis]|nr:MAG: hypothetical protein AWM53_01892 [Candidatus Dichloromethanomonas elyunquensis]
MLWMMEIQRFRRSLVARSVGEKCTLSIIRDFMVMNIKFQILEDNKRTEAAASVFLILQDSAPIINNRTMESFPLLAEFAYTDVTIFIVCVSKRKAL